MNVLAFLMRRSRAMLACAVLAGAASGLAGAAVIALLPRILARPIGSGAELTRTFLGLAIVAVASKAASEMLLTRLGQSTIAEVRVELARRIIDAPFERFETLGAHRVLATLNDDASVVSQAFVYVPMLLVNGATVLGCLAYVGTLSASVLAVVLGAMLIGAVIFTAHERRALGSFKRAREASDALFRHFRALTYGFKELKLDRARGNAFVDTLLAGATNDYRQHHVRGMTLYSLALGWGSMLFYAVLGAAVFVLPEFVHLDGESATGAALTLLYVMGPFAMVLEVLPLLGRAEIAIAKWRELGLSLGEERASVVSARPSRRFERLDLVGVTHRYRREGEEDSFQLGPVDLALRPGELVFIVGGNGSGKTTLAMLLLGLHAPESGEARVNGKPVTDRDRDAYRQLFSAIFADFYVFDELVDLSDPARLARARELLARLRLEHRVSIADGRLRVGGLSHGQRKRLALLTSFLDDRPIYVFDEWAADQDPQFRRVFYTELLPELRARGTTAVVITHDDQYFSIADRCLRMERGVLSEMTAPLPIERVAARSLS